MDMSRDPFQLAFVQGVTPSKWVGVWRERMPSVPIELRPVSQSDAEASVTSGTVHVALLRLPFSADGVDRITLYSERAVVVVPKGHALESAGSVVLSDLAGEHRLPGTDSATVELVAAGAGVAVMPQSVARLLSRKDVASIFVEDAPETQIALVWRTERTGPMIEEFIGIVRGRTANSSRGAAAAPQSSVSEKGKAARSEKGRSAQKATQRKPQSRRPRSSR
jgi:DNA-binding transcriptional LysR family regulator